MKIPRKLKKALKKVLLKSIPCKDWKSSDVQITNISNLQKYKNRCPRYNNISITGYKLGF